MYNKYFTMKKSLLREAIKNEIISTLSKGSLNENAPGFANRKMGDPLPTLESVKAAYEAKKEKVNERMAYDVELEDVVYTPEGDEVKVVDIRDIGGSNERAYTVEKTDGTRFELGDKSLELTGDKLKRDSEGIEGVSKYYSKKDVSEMKPQGYDDREDESLGARRGAEKGKKQSMKDRRDDSYGKFGKRDAEEKGKNKINKEEMSKDKLKEGHSLSSEDLDVLKSLASSDDISLRAVKVLKSLIKSNIKQGDLGTKVDEASSIREEDEMSDDDKDKAASKEAKKKDSIASISNKLQKLIAKMKEKAKDFKEAEGKAKDKLKDDLKDMTVEKKKLEKSL